MATSICREWSTTTPAGCCGAATGRDENTLRRFFNALGPDRCAQVTHVSADAAGWIAAVVAERYDNAVRCGDPFHIVKWGTEALDDVRRGAWNHAKGRRRDKATGHARLHQSAVTVSARSS